MLLFCHLLSFGFYFYMLILHAQTGYSAVCPKHSCMLQVGLPGLCFGMIPIAPAGLGAFINVKIRPKKEAGQCDHGVY